MVWGLTRVLKCELAVTAELDARIRIPCVPVELIPSIVTYGGSNWLKASICTTSRVCSVDLMVDERETRPGSPQPRHLATSIDLGKCQEDVLKEIKSICSLLVDGWSVLGSKILDVSLVAQFSSLFTMHELIDSR
jgi:hypothetical protein